MDLIKVFQRFPDHESCIEHLERVRWPSVPACPLCGCVTVARKAENDRIGRWNCHGCKSSFNVLSGTIFQKTKVTSIAEVVPGNLPGTQCQKVDLIAPAGP